MTAPDEKYRKVILRCTPASTGTQPVLDAPSVIPHAASCEYPSFNAFWSFHLAHRAKKHKQKCKCKKRLKQDIQIKVSRQWQ